MYAFMLMTEGVNKEKTFTRKLILELSLICLFWVSLINYQNLLSLIHVWLSNLTKYFSIDIIHHLHFKTTIIYHDTALFV